MPIFDIIILLFAVFYFFKGYRTGFILSIVKVIALLLGVLIAIHFSGWLSKQLFQESEGWLARFFPMISYLILFTLVVWGSKLLGSFIQKAISIPIAGTLNRLMGGIIYVLIFAIIASSFIWLGSHMGIWNPATSESTMTFKYIQPIAPKVFENIGVILPFAKDTFQQLNDFFSNLSQSIDS